jgi:hypothetical protein
VCDLLFVSATSFFRRLSVDGVVIGSSVSWMAVCQRNLVRRVKIDFTRGVYTR